MSASQNRRTRPSDRSRRPAAGAPLSPRWYAPLMLSVMGFGALVIAANYVDLVPGGHNHSLVYVGFGFIVIGFMMATKYR